MATELHVLNDAHMERRAAGDDSLEALRGTAERLYAQLVIAANNTAAAALLDARAASPATCAGPGWSKAAPSTSPARSASTAPPSSAACAQGRGRPSRPRAATR